MRFLFSFIVAVGCHLVLFAYVNPLADIEVPALDGGSISVTISSTETGATELTEEKVIEERPVEHIKEQEVVEEIREVEEDVKTEKSSEEKRVESQSQSKVESNKPEVIENEELTVPDVPEPIKIGHVPVKKKCKKPVKRQKTLPEKKTSKSKKTEVVPQKKAEEVKRDEKVEKIETTRSANNLQQAEKVSENPNPAPARSNAVVEAKPDYKKNRKPVYPKLARRRGWEGVVELSVLVGMDGYVRELALHKSSGFEVLDRAALKTVKKWFFQPGKRNGRAVEMRVLVPVRFRLN